MRRMPTQRQQLGREGRAPAVLDLGCGTGLLSAYCLKHGAGSVVAVDTNQTMVNLCRRALGREKLPYEQLLGDALDGDMTRFATQPIIEGTWTALAPVVADPPPATVYEPGTMGPETADKLMEGYHGWIQPVAGPSDRPA